MASALVDFGVRHADAMKARVFTEASPRGQSVYTRKGFVSTENVVLKGKGRDDAGKDGSAVVWYHMEREPGATEGGTL